MVDIKQFHFNKQGLLQIEREEMISKTNWSKNWPVVYIITNDNEMYVGETVKINSRIKQHFENEERKKLKEIYILVDKTFNKSAILDIESLLIKYFSSDSKKIKLQNGNKGLIAHDYYEKEKYKEIFKQIWNELRKINLANQTLREIENSNVFKYSPYTSLDYRQYEVMQEILKDLSNNNNLKKLSFVINGAPGTGKTLLGVYLMKLLNSKQENFEDDEITHSLKLIKNNIKNIALVIPQKSLRKTLKNVFREINGLDSKMVISPNDVVRSKYDLLIVDEAHRLRKRKNITNYKSFDDNNKFLNLPKDATELDWIIKNSKNQIFFYDKNQIIKPTDIDIKIFNEKINIRKSYELKSQFRVLAGEDYIEYIKSLFNCNVDKFKKFKNYEFKLFDNINDLSKLIKNKDEIFGLSRLIAGYGWKWKTKNEFSHDIEIQGMKFKWNSQSEDWINSPKSKQEIGCIHTTQGYDLNYAGVIIGPEIGYDKEKNEIIINEENYYDIKGKVGISNLTELKEYIKNIYGVLLTRGIRGTYIYICDDNLREYFKKYIESI